jgi:carbonic anhydrase
VTSVPIGAAQALERLREGNRRFAAGQGSLDGPSSRDRRALLLAGQQPFAIVLGCSDSRVPAEIVFDQGLGDLFVIRVAGNVVAASQIGSVEFAAERFGTRLVVVLGHTQCGAVQATLEELGRPDRARSPHLRSIVDRIRPSVESLLAGPAPRDPEALAREAARAHVRLAARQLRQGSEVLEALIARDGLVVVGALYDLATGLVDVFDGAAEVSSGPWGGRTLMAGVHPVGPEEGDRLVEVWEASVRATHHFLTEAHIQSLKPLVREGLWGLPALDCARDAEGTLVGFVGVADGKMEALFIHPAWRGAGVGRRLVDHAVGRYGATTVDVNEQNEQAVGFYRRLGFEVEGRSDTDSAGRPFPLLHMRLRAGAPPVPPREAGPPVGDRD